MGYRQFMRKQAVELGVNGHVENLADGRVEVVAEGFLEDLELLLVRMRAGPAHAEVKAIEVEWADAGGLSGFYTY